MNGIFQQQADWLQQRLGKFTGSEMHKLLKSGKGKDKVFGDTAMTYINEKVAEIITGEGKAPLSGRALEWGASNEFEAVEAFKALTGCEVEYFGVAEPKFIPFNAYSGFSPDALDDAFLLESKCPYNSDVHIDYLLLARGDNHGAALKDYSIEYYTQIQFGMMCAKKELAVFISYDPRAIEEQNKLAILQIPADKEHQELIETRLTLAAKIVNDKLALLDKEPPLFTFLTPSVIIAQREGDVTVVQAA